MREGERGGGGRSPLPHATPTLRVSVGVVAIVANVKVCTNKNKKHMKNHV